MSTDTAAPEALWTAEQTAHFLNLTNVRTLNAWRLRRQGPAYIKVGTLCRYSPAVVRDWLASRTVAPAGAA